MIVLSRFLENDKIFKGLIQTVGLPILLVLLFLEIFKKSSENVKKKNAENDQLTVNCGDFFNTLLVIMTVNCVEFLKHTFSN